MPPYFIDFEAFQHGKDNDFQVKELCMVDADRPYAPPLHFVFGPNKKWQMCTNEEKRTYCYLMHHWHKLGWYEGASLYRPLDVIREMKKVFPCFSHAITYVLGYEKLKFLQREFPMMNLREYGTTRKMLPQLPLNVSCPYRYHGKNCACLKCYPLIEHYYELAF